MPDPPNITQSAFMWTMLFGSIPQSAAQSVGELLNATLGVRSNGCRLADADYRFVVPFIPKN